MTPNCAASVALKKPALRKSVVVVVVVVVRVLEAPYDCAEECGVNELALRKSVVVVVVVVRVLEAPYGCAHNCVGGGAPLTCWKPFLWCSDSWHMRLAT